MRTSVTQHTTRVWPASNDMLVRDPVAWLMGTRSTPAQYSIVIPSHTRYDGDAIHLTKTIQTTDNKSSKEPRGRAAETRRVLTSYVPYVLHYLRILAGAKCGVLFGDPHSKAKLAISS